MEIDIDFGHQQFQNVELSLDKEIAPRLSVFNSSIHQDLKFCCFDGSLDAPGGKHIAVNMNISNHFESYESLPDNFMGLFLFSISQMESIKGTGKYGCPQRLFMGDGVSHFSFLGNNFYPFITVNYNVGYYVCESGGRHTWLVLGPNRNPDYFNKYKVSINYPISYDPMLGIFTTRDAEVMA